MLSLHHHHYMQAITQSPHWNSWHRLIGKKWGRHVTLAGDIAVPTSCHQSLAHNSSWQGKVSDLRDTERKHIYTAMHLSGGVYYAFATKNDYIDRHITKCYPPFWLPHQFQRFYLLHTNILACNYDIYILVPEDVCFILCICTHHIWAWFT